MKNNINLCSAGSRIENIKYTNSLEAINQSISLGFKIIEIDLKALDKFGGVHDWISFKNNSNYISTNENTILYDEFLNLRLFNKYKPLEVDQINKIFGENSDIVATDKTNNFEKYIKILNSIKIEF